MSKGIISQFAVPRQQIQEALHAELVKVASGYSALDVAAVMVNLLVEAHVKSCETWEEAEHTLRQFFNAAMTMMHEDYSPATGKRKPGLGLTRDKPVYRKVIDAGAPHEPTNLV